MDPASPMTTDPTLEVQDDSRAVEVTALLGDSVLAVRYLESAAAPGVRPLTLVLLVGSGSLVAIGCAALALGLPGLAALAWIIGVGLGIYGALAWREQRPLPRICGGSAPEADLPLISPSLPTPCFPLVRSRGHGLELVIAARMVGRVAVGERETDLAALRGSGIAEPDREVAGAVAYPLPPDARVTLDFEPLTLVLRSVRPPRRPSRPLLQRIDWRALRFTGAALGAHAIALLLALAVPPRSRIYDADDFALRSAVVTLPVQPPPRRPERAFGDGDGDGGRDAGRRHAGEGGRMGCASCAQRANGLYRLRGPVNNPDPHLARPRPPAPALAGVLGLLDRGGDHLASVFGHSSALGRDAERAMGGLVANVLGAAYGVGGLGLVGTGRGGGCRGGGCGQGTIGLGSFGTIGRGSCDDSSRPCYGRGLGRIAGCGRGGRWPGCASVDAIAGAAMVRGALDKEIIRRVVRRNINQVRYCYEKELQRRWNVSGRLAITFVISGNGAVASSVVESSTLGNSDVETCVAAAVRRWMFPKPTGGGVVVVTYPFRMHVVGDPHEE
jgi:hypothetical protein